MLRNGFFEFLFEELQGGALLIVFCASSVAVSDNALTLLSLSWIGYLAKRFCSALTG